MHCVHTVMDMSFHRTRGEGESLLVLDKICCDLGEGRTMRPAMLAYCRVNVPYELLPFLAWSKRWREAVWYELRCRVSIIDSECYLVG